VSTLTDEPRLSIPAATKRPSRRFDGRLVTILTVAVAGLIALAAVIATGFKTGEPPPAAGAAALVPGDALAYVHLSTDRRRAGVTRALALAGRFPDAPLLTAALSDRLGAILSRPGTPAGTFEFATAVRPWLGKEAALALLNTPSTTAGSLILLDVRNRARAQAFLDSTGATPVRAYRGATELRYRQGTVLAFVRHYLAIGQRASVEGAIDVAGGSTTSLGANPAYRSAAASEPADRVLDAYVSQAGVRRVLAPRGGLLGALGQLLLQPAVSGTTISLSAVPGGARVAVRSALDPSLAQASGPPAPLFAPTLPSALPAGSSVLLDTHGLPREAPRVLAGTAAAGIAPRIGPLLQRLGGALSSEGENVPQLMSLFSGETVVAIVPGTDAHGRADGGPAPVVLARAAHPDQAEGLLADLQGPLAQVFPLPSAGPGQAPEWSDAHVAGITAHQLSITPGLQLDYAVFRGVVVVSTSLRAIGAIARHQSSLTDGRLYQKALPRGHGRVTSLVFLDFSQLLNLGEQMGLSSSARLSTVRPDLERIRTVGLASSRGEADTTAELFLQIP
jgi:hypothetical protein